MAAITEEEFLTPAQLAQRWQVPVSQLANWRYQGRGPGYIKVEKLVRYPLRLVRAYEAEQEAA